MSEHVTGQTEGDGVKRRPGRPPRAREMSDERFEDERGQNERELYEDRERDEEERLELFLDTQHQTVLPNLPTMDGYHVCWLTTSNPRDSIPWRLQVGYELIRIEDCPQWQGSAAQAGSLSGVVSVNEMVAARIPISLYNKLMKAVGHALPLVEEEKVRNQSQTFQQLARSRGLRVEEGEGTAEIVQRAGSMPVFTE